MKGTKQPAQSFTENEIAPSVKTSTLVLTDLGWFGIAWEGESVSRLTFGHATKRDAKSDLSEIAGGRPTRVDALRGPHRDLVDRVVDYASGAPSDFSDISLRLHPMTPFQAKVLRACRRIPWGQTRSYGDLAADAGSARAARAVGTVMASNRHPILIPCHRVIAANRQVGGFSAPGGSRMKMRLLKMESAAD